MRGIAQSVVLLAVVYSAAGCTTWKHNPSAREGIARANSGEIHVYRADGSMVSLVNASIVGDSVVGSSAMTGARVAIPLSAVVSTETKGVSGGKTALLGGGVLLGVVAIAGVVLIIALASVVATN